MKKQVKNDKSIMVYESKPSFGIIVVVYSCTIKLTF